MTTQHSALTPTITYDPETRDFVMELDGELVGFAATYQSAEAELNALVYAILQEEAEAEILAAPAADASTAGCVTLAVADLRTDLEAAVEASRATVATNARWLKAVETAWTWLRRQETLRYRPTDHALVVPSATDAGTVYTANGVCQCPAWTKQHVACWHRAAARLVRRALERSAARALKTVTQTQHSALTPTITYDPETRDFVMELDGELVGFAATYQSAEAELNALITRILGAREEFATVATAELLELRASAEAAGTPVARRAAIAA